MMTKMKIKAKGKVLTKTKKENLLNKMRQQGVLKMSAAEL